MARTVRERVNEHGILIALIGAAAVVLAGVLPIYLGRATGGGNGTPGDVAGAATTFTPTAGGIGKPGSLTVEDDVIGGAWALPSPTARVLAPRERQPVEGAKWIANGTTVKLACAKPGTPYRVIVNTVPKTWHWWAELKTALLWLPMAAFKETKLDGSSGLARCM